MVLSVRQLELVLRKTKDREKNASLLREEIRRVFGPTLDVEVDVSELAESVNDQIEVLKRTGRETKSRIKHSVLAKFVNDKDPEIRAMVANLLPESALKIYVTDRDQRVRHVVASRVTVDVLKEMVKRDPADDYVKFLYKSKLNEAKEEKKSRLGQAVKQQDIPELTKTWYREKARDVLETYYSNQLEFRGEEKFIDSLCSQVRVTTGVEIDRDELLKALLDEIKDREDTALKKHESRLSECAATLRRPVLVAEEERVDPVKELLQTQTSSTEYVSKATRVFNVKESRLPGSLKKFSVNQTPVMLPVKGRLPHAEGLRHLDERALDKFVAAWSEVQARAGDPIVLNWSPDPSEPGVVTFEAVLR